MTLAEKINSVPKLERIDSTIDSCIKILEQELEKRKIEAPDWRDETQETLNVLYELEGSFNIMRGKK